MLRKLEQKEKGSVNQRLRWEKSLEQNVENTGVINMLTEEELRLSQNQDTNDKCSKCHSSDITRSYVDTHDVLHCICNACAYEWVE